MMNNEQQLDYMLEHLKNVTAGLDRKPEDIIPSHPELNSEYLMRPLLAHLVSDKYVDSWAGMNTYKINLRGITFLRDGGYVGAKKRAEEREQLAKESIKLNEESIKLSKKSLELSNKSLKTSSRNTTWVIIGVVISILALGVAVYSLFSNKP